MDGNSAADPRHGKLDQVGPTDILFYINLRAVRSLFLLNLVKMSQVINVIVRDS